MVKAGKIILTAGQFARFPSSNKTLVVLWQNQGKDLSRGSLDYKFSAVTTRSHCLQKNSIH